MIANCMFFDIDLPCFSRKLIRVNNHVAYVIIDIKNKIKNFETHISGVTQIQEERERKEGATPA